METYKKLINNSVIFAIGRLGSQLISFILVPLYTYYLTRSEYGTVDLVITTVQMLIPIVSVSVYEAVLRFIMDDQSQRNKVIVNSLFTVFLGFIISLLFYPIIVKLGLVGDSMIVMYLFIILFVQLIERIFGEYARAIGEIKVFALNGIILTFLTGSLNIFFLMTMKMGISGYFLSIIIANLLSVIFLVVKTRIYKTIDLSLINLNVLKSLAYYSLPLVPNTLMWWLINASSRYFIRYSIGVDANGLFAVASKIPSVITILTQVFMQAWQLSAIEEYNSKNKSEFYSKVFNILSMTLFLITSLIITVLKLSFNILFDTDFYAAWTVVPFLLIGSVFSSFSGFLGTNYIASKSTKGAFKTSIYGGVVSLVLNFILITHFGLVGAGLSSMGSFIIMWLLRVYDTREFVKIRVNWLQFVGAFLLVIIQTGILFLDLAIGFEITLNITMILIIVFINRQLIIDLLNVVFKRK